MYETNPKKNNRARRKRPVREEPKSSWVQVTTKSNSGVVHIHFKETTSINPQGHNRASLRAELAKSKQRKIDY